MAVCVPSYREGLSMEDRGQSGNPLRFLLSTAHRRGTSPPVQFTHYQNPHESQTSLCYEDRPTEALPGERLHSHYSQYRLSLQLTITYSPALMSQTLTAATLMSHGFKMFVSNKRILPGQTKRGSHIRTHKTRSIRRKG